MKYFLAASLFFSLSLKAQQSFNCNSHFEFEKRMETDPVFKANQMQLERETELFMQTKAARAATATYVIPVVFHIIHTGGAGNISNAQIVNQIGILNNEFKRLQADTVLTPTGFKSAAAPFDVEFRLATIGPDGQCTNGINRVYSSLSDCSLNQEEVKSLSYWPSNQYLNIWIVQSMHYSGSLNCDGGGYASFPGGPAALDGINIRGDLISSIGTAATNNSWGNFFGRYLIHELGHWFNLRHIWGDAQCGNDLVSDTPPAQFSNSNCPSYPHNPNSACGSGPNGEMFTNYMDYTNGPCLNMFTAGQVTRMTAAINSAVSGRNNLWSTSNLALTGVSDPYTYPVACGANPAVGPYSIVTICAGDSVKLTDLSYGGNHGTRLWNFNGQPSSSLTDSIVWVKYPVAGKYSYSLTKTYLNVSKTANNFEKVVVLNRVPNTNYVVPFTDDFENPLAYFDEWTAVNRDSGSVGWEHNGSTGYSGIYCIGLENFGNGAPFIDDVYSPTYDLSSVVSPSVTFRLFYAQKATSNYDKLQVFISKDCGTWASVYQRSGASLATTTLMVNNSYTPAFASEEWRLEKINLLPFLADGVVKFKFAFTSGGGNNIFLDDINIEGINISGLQSLEEGKRILIFPNPSKGKVIIDLNTIANKNYDVEIVDLTGRTCYQQTMKEEQQIELDLNSLEIGLYIVSIKHEGRVIKQQKLVRVQE